MSIKSLLRNLRRRWFFQWLYFGKPPWDTGVTPPELVAFIASNPPGRALDLGCGTGTNAIALAKAGWEVTGVDYIGKAIKKGRKKARQTGVTVELYQGDVTHLDNIHGPFDLVLDIGCFHNLDRAGKLAYIKQIVRFLAPDGTYLMYGFYSASELENTGIKPSELEMLAQHLECIERVNGEDRGARPSAWFTYRLKN